MSVPGRMGAMLQYLKSDRPQAFIIRGSSAENFCIPVTVPCPLGPVRLWVNAMESGNDVFGKTVLEGGRSEG